jgi:hypothetical protein
VRVGKETKKTDRDGEDSWQLVSPEPLFLAGDRATNAHPRDLQGKRIALYWNGNPNADIFLTRLAELLGSKIDDVTMVKVWEELPHTRQTDPNLEASRNAAAQIAALKPDIVIAAAGDCVGSATWLITDQLNLEAMGVPTVTCVTEPFLEVARSVPRSLGFRDVCLVPIPPPLGMISAAEAANKAEDAFDAVTKAAAGWDPEAENDASRTPGKAHTFAFPRNIELLNEHFREKGWSLGLPVLPPTRERVAEMLKGCDREPHEVLGSVPPAMGILTVELAAVYATIAGCTPAYMPLLLSAMEALLAPEANLRLALSGTGTSQLLVIVNGPVVGHIGLACGQGAAGKGHQANGAIGYAISLIAYGIGGSRPPSMDRSTLGSPGDYVCWVFGENTEALPAGWEPLHTERGFSEEESVVTVMACYPPIENMDHWSASAEEHAQWWGTVVNPFLNMGGPPIPQILDQNPLVALGPEHAQLIAASGWGKDDFRKALWRATGRPLSLWPKAAVGERIAGILKSADPDAIVPVALRPEQFIIVIAGGDGKQSHYFAPLPGAFPVSRLVSERGVNSI